MNIEDDIFSCDNCGKKFNAEKAAILGFTCDKCRDTIEVYSVDTAELILAKDAKVAELEKQLAPLKKCVNCISAHYFPERDPSSICRTCKDHSNWKGREG